jgi:hypothetical protein
MAGKGKRVFTFLLFELAIEALIKSRQNQILLDEINHGM